MHLGYDNQAPWWRVTAILIPRGGPAKRLRDEAKAIGRLMDATGGRKVRSMVITDANQVILSAISPETLRERLEKKRQAAG